MKNYTIQIFSRIVALESNTINVGTLTVVSNWNLPKWLWWLLILPLTFQSYNPPPTPTPAPARGCEWKRLKRLSSEILVGPKTFRSHNREAFTNTDQLVPLTASTVKSVRIQASLNTRGRRLTPTDMTPYKSEWTDRERERERARVNTVAPLKRAECFCVM